MSQVPHYQLWKTGTYLYCVVNTMTTDDLTTQGARASAVMALTYVPQNVQASAPTGIILWRRYIVMSSLIGWAHTQNYPCTKSANFSFSNVMIFLTLVKGVFQQQSRRILNVIFFLEKKYTSFHRRNWTLQSQRKWAWYIYNRKSTSETLKGWLSHCEVLWLAEIHPFRAMSSYSRVPL